MGVCVACPAVVLSGGVHLMAVSSPIEPLSGCLHFDWCFFDYPHPESSFHCDTCSECGLVVIGVFPCLFAGISSFMESSEGGECFHICFFTSGISFVIVARSGGGGVFSTATGTSFLLMRLILRAYTNIPPLLAAHVMSWLLPTVVKSG